VATCALVKELFTSEADGIVFEDSEAPDDIIGIENVLVPVKVLLRPKMAVPPMLFAYPTVQNSALFNPLFGPRLVVGYDPLKLHILTCKSIYCC